MPDITLEKLIFFVFAVAPGFIAIQVYGLKCPAPKKDWGNSLVEIVTYSLVNLSLWISWVQSLIRRPFDQIGKLELTAAFVLICVASPACLSLAWFYLRTKLLHRKLGVDHPTPRGWEHFVRNNGEFWVLFHLKTGKQLGGYFGDKSYAATYPQEQEMYVEEIWRVDENGEFVEMVDGTLGGVIRIAECERVEFLHVNRGSQPNETESHSTQGPTGSNIVRDCSSEESGGQRASGGVPGPDHASGTASDTAEGRVGNGSPQGTEKVISC